MKIVVGSDFSPNSIEAANLASVFATRLNATLVLAHVADTRVLKGIPREAIREFLNSAREQLKNETARLRKTGVAVNAKFHQGSVDEELAAESETADIVIISALSWRKHGKWLLGTVAQRLSQASASPLLVLRNPAPLLDWARGKRTARIFCAYDGTPVSEAALNFVSFLQRLGPVEIIVAQVKSLSAERQRLGNTGADPAALRQILETQLKEKIGESLGNIPIRIHFEESELPPALRLIELASEEKVDLIISGTHQWKGFEKLLHDSTSRDLLQYASQNVLVVPSRKQIAKLPRMKRVLVPISFSPKDEAALRYAYAILPDGGEVHLLAVVDPLALPDGSFISGMRSPGTTELHQNLLESTSLRLKEAIPNWLGGDRHRTVTQVVESSDVAEAIVHAAERIAADAIVVWTEGSGKARARIMGSIPQKILAKSTRPLFVVHPD